MPAGANFGCPKFTFDRISGHFRSNGSFNFFLNFWPNGCRRPFWMSKIHFRLHFWPFWINTKIFFYKMAGGPILDVRMNYLISGHFKSIRNLIFFGKFLTKWLPSAILDVRNSLLIAFLAILINTEFFGRSKITFDCISGHLWSIGHFWWHFWAFQIHTDINFILNFHKMAASGHFGCPKITFYRIPGHFCPSIRNFFYCWQNGHFGWDDNVSYRTRPRYLDE